MRRFLARREAGKLLRVYVVDTEQGPTKAGIFEPRLGLAALIPGSPSSLCSPGVYALANSRAEALAAFYNLEAQL